MPGGDGREAGSLGCGLDGAQLVAGEAELEERGGALACLELWAAGFAGFHFRVARNCPADGVSPVMACPFDWKISTETGKPRFAASSDAMADSICPGVISSISTLVIFAE